MTNSNGRLRVLSCGFTAAILLAGTAHADMNEIKTYKTAFPDAKPKCIECHVAAMPKKDDGQHELNAYGTAVVTEAKAEAEAAKIAAGTEVKPTAATYTKVGKIEDFKK